MAMMGSRDHGRALFKAHSQLMGSSVRVYFTQDQTFVSGVLYAIDPESGDVALLQSPTSTASEDDGGMAVKIVMGHAIDRLTVDEAASAITLKAVKQAVASQSADHELKIPHVDVDASELTQRLQEFLDQRFIPHTPGSPPEAQAMLSVFGGAATLRFPFTPDCVDCTNEQILLRLQALLDDFQREYRG